MDERLEELKENFGKMSKLLLINIIKNDIYTSYLDVLDKTVQYILKLKHEGERAI